MKNIFWNALPFILIALLLASIVHFALNAMDRKAVAECQQWQAQLETNPHFYVVDWQKAQCTYHGITI